ncbi:hypothetical protein ABE85_10930 [Mitsuaria sp. 7]|nr:hypothetical protein ABE85_10930 [Mitsuaria sp. 7]
MAATADNLLADFIFPFFNAARTPAFGGFPSVLQGALPLSERVMEAQGAIAFANLLDQERITDLIVAEGDVPSPLLAGLRAPGDSMSWEMPGPGGQPMKAHFRRLDEPTDDGSWMLQVELTQGGITTSQRVRTHDVKVDPHHPQQFREGVSRGYTGWQRASADGQDARMAVFCNDGSRDSGTVIAAMRQMHHQETHEAGSHPGATVPPQEMRRDDNAFLRECRDQCGPSFAEGGEMFLTPVARRPTEGSRDRPDHRAAAMSSPPARLFGPEFAGAQRRRQPVDDGIGDSDGDFDSMSGSVSDSVFESDASGDSSSDAESVSDSSSQSGSYWLDDDLSAADRLEHRLRDFDEDAPPASSRSVHPRPPADERPPALSARADATRTGSVAAAGPEQPRSPPARPAAPRQRLASPRSEGTAAQRTPVSNHLVKQLQAERAALQERQLNRLPNAPRTALPDLDGQAKTPRDKVDAAALERRLAQARQAAVPERRQTAPTQDAGSAADEIDESWTLLSSLADEALPEVDRLDRASVPKQPAASTASGARLPRSASAPQFQLETRAVPTEAITRTSSEPDLRLASLPVLDRQLAPAARHLVGGLLGEPVRATGLGALLQRATGRPARASLQTRLENDLQSLIAKLRGEHAARVERKQSEGLAEQEFVVSHLARHMVDAMAARSDAERLRMFKAIDAGSDDWLDALDRRDELLERLEGAVVMPAATFAQTRDGYRALDYGLEAMQRAHGLLWAAAPDGIGAVSGGRRRPADPPAA